MAVCEKCWSDAADAAHYRGGAQVDHYRAFVAERDCTPEEQCGEMHLVIGWTDGRNDQCLCGKVVRDFRAEDVVDAARAQPKETQ